MYLTLLLDDLSESAAWSKFLGVKFKYLQCIIMDMSNKFKGLIMGVLIGLFSIPFWFGIGSGPDRFFLVRILYNFYVEFIGKLFLLIIPCSGEACMILIFIGPVLTAILFGFIGFLIGHFVDRKTQ